MTLWGWARANWKRPGVGAACLALQDDHGQCVPLLLWGMWLFENGTGPDDEAIERAVVLCRTESSSFIEPLRKARREAPPSDRDRLLAEELEAERGLLNRLETIPTSTNARPANLQSRLAKLSARWGRPLGAKGFADLTREFADVG